VPGTPRSSTGPRSSKPVARADDQVAHGAGDEDFAGAGLSEDPRRDLYGEPADVGVQQFTFAGVDAGADLDTQCFGLSAQGRAAKHISGTFPRVPASAHHRSSGMRYIVTVRYIMYQWMTTRRND
jgi:hypothetical protein